MPQPTTPSRNGAALAALLLIQLAVGYEWIVSGASKLANGDFAGGLAAQLSEMSKQAPGWYRGFLADAVLPHASAFGYSIEVGELLVGIVLAAAAIVLLLDTPRIPARARRGLQLASGAAALTGIVMAANFELANNGHFGTTLASDSFDEGVDLDTIMIALQLALLVFGAAALPRRRHHRSHVEHTRLIADA